MNRKALAASAGTCDMVPMLNIASLVIVIGVVRLMLGGGII